MSGLEQLATPDIVIIIAVIISALIGITRGLLKELISLASWVAAFMLSLFFAPMLAEILSDTFSQSRAASDQGGLFSGLTGDNTTLLVVAFLSIFVSTLFAAGILQWMVAKFVKGTGLSGTDRFLGLLFGAARGAIVCIVVLIAVRPFAMDTYGWPTSTLIPVLLEFEEDVLVLMGKARNALSGSLQELPKLPVQLPGGTDI